MISEFPLFMFTTLAGLAIGAYATSAVFPVGKVQGEGEGAKRPWLFPLACLVLLAVGLVFLPLHLGHPERMFSALTHPGAMISQEAYWSAAFGVVLLIDVILSKSKGAAPRALRVVGAIVGLVLTFAMANAYFVSMGVAAWATWQTFLLYFFGNLAMGAALCALFERGLLENKGYVTAAVVLAVLAIIAFALEAAHFAGVGSDFILFIVGIVLAAVGAAILWVAKSGKMAKKTAAWAAFACLFVGVACARYCFYAACVL